MALYTTSIPPLAIYLYVYGILNPHISECKPSSCSVHSSPYADSLRSLAIPFPIHLPSLFESSLESNPPSTYTRRYIFRHCNCFSDVSLSLPSQSVLFPTEIFIHVMHFSSRLSCSNVPHLASLLQILYIKNLAKTFVICLVQSVVRFGSRVGYKTQQREETVAEGTTMPTDGANIQMRADRDE